MNARKDPRIERHATEFITTGEWLTDHQLAKLASSGAISGSGRKTYRWTFASCAVAAVAVVSAAWLVYVRWGS